MLVGVAPAPRPPMLLLDIERAVEAFADCETDCSLLLSDALTLLRCELPGVAFRLPLVVLVIDWTLAGALLTVEEGIPERVGKTPSRVVGRPFPLLPFRLRVESGRGGGTTGGEG